MYLGFHACMYGWQQVLNIAALVLTIFVFIWGGGGREEGFFSPQSTYLLRQILQGFKIADELYSISLPPTSRGSWTWSYLSLPSQQSYEVG